MIAFLNFKMESIKAGGAAHLLASPGMYVLLVMKESHVKLRTG